MIIFRYIAREIIITTIAVSSILLLIIMSGRFIRYLAQAARGVVETSVLLEIMLYKVPNFMQLIIPLGLFLAILLGLGRMYVDNEISVLTMAGVSQKSILKIILVVALMMAGVVASLSLGLTPYGARKVSQITRSQEVLNEFDTITAGKFLTNKQRVTYVEELSDDRTKLKGVFMSGSASGKNILLVAKNGEQQLTASGDRYLILHDGARYDGNFEANDYQITKFATYAILIARKQAKASKSLELVSTSTLLQNNDKASQIEFYWRISLVILAVIIPIIAVPLAKVNPRQGRFIKILPAIFLYILYLGSLISMNGALHESNLSALIGFGSIHLFFLVIGLILVNSENITRKLTQSKNSKN